jgi:hypothetical protein
MSAQKKNFVIRILPLLLLKEPYEMTYWKNKLNSPFNRLKMAARRLWIHLFHIAPLEVTKVFIGNRPVMARLVPCLPGIFRAVAHHKYRG